jgi:hypothetical protein
MGCRCASLVEPPYLHVAVQLKTGALVKDISMFGIRAVVKESREKRYLSVAIAVHLETVVHLYDIIRGYLGR